MTSVLIFADAKYHDILKEAQWIWSPNLPLKRCRLNLTNNIWLWNWLFIAFRRFKINVKKHVNAYYSKILKLQPCFPFLDDDHWYRAVILGITASKVKVVYADYGNVEELPLSRLQPIPAFLLELPFQILKCSLAGSKQPVNFPYIKTKFAYSKWHKFDSLLTYS